MLEQIDWIQTACNLFNQSTERILWNLFLAFIPLALSLYLFRTLAQRNIWWWASLLIFVAFLPNAPYVLTDSIHIIELSQQNYPLWAILAILIPQYTVFIVLGFEAYVVSLSKFGSYLANLAWFDHPTLFKAIAHGLCIVGIYIGRFERFNSWDFISKPGTVLLTTIRDLADSQKLASMAIAFLLLWLLNELVEIVNNKLKRQITNN